MRVQLAKLGITCRELPDGIEVDGCGGELPKISTENKPLISCYNDHRIAMSFAVLGCAFPGYIIADKECTDKTFPEFWHDTSTHLGVKMEHPPVGFHDSSDGHGDVVTIDPAQSVVLIGMRASGKTHLGRMAGSVLKWPVVDIDMLVEQELGCPIKSFIKEGKPGSNVAAAEPEADRWVQFRDVEARVLKGALEQYPKQAVIVCGGGIIETPQCVDLLSHHHMVIQIARHIDDIEAFLEDEKNRPSYQDSVRNVWNRRQPLFAKSSTYEFTIAKGETNWDFVNRNFAKFVLFVTGGFPQASALGGSISLTEFHPKPWSLLSGPNTSFLSLTYPSLQEPFDSGDLGKMTKGATLIELRVDLLASVNAMYVKEQVAILRKCTDKPIIFTVRTKVQGGNFEGSNSEMMSLLQLGVRCGCEVIDVEATLPTKMKRDFASSCGNSKVLFSHHEVRNTSALGPEKIRDMFIMAYGKGLGHVVKLVVKVFSVTEVCMMEQVVADLTAKGKFGDCAVIWLCTTDCGRLSRVLNNTLTPVTHALMPFAAAPGQMTLEHIMKIRGEMGIQPAKKYYLLGHGISLSPSPAMHNAGFKELAFPHEYQLFDTDDLGKVKDLLSQTDFGGASVTMPHKLAVMEFMDELTPHASTIGAVNTIIKLDNGTLRGDNTDWIGIQRPILNRLAKRTQQQPKELTAMTGVVVGAGGAAMAAAYALSALGMKLYVYNRTHSKAEEVAAKFGGKACTSLADIEEVVDVVVSTIPGSAEFSLPDKIVGQKPVVFEAAYKPPMTAILKQAIQESCQCVQGYEMLVEQGVEQFERWMECPAPTSTMREAVVAKFQPEDVIPASQSS
jgi:pentafunctional AROM polypeptide